MIEQDLARIAAALERIATHLDTPPAAVAPVPVAATPEPAAPVSSLQEARERKAQPEVSLEDLRARMRALSAQSPARREQVLEALKGLGVPTLTKLEATRYGELALRLDALETA